MATRIHSGPVGVVYTDGVPTDIAVQSSGTTKGLGVVTGSTDPVTLMTSLATPSKSVPLGLGVPYTLAIAGVPTMTAPNGTIATNGTVTFSTAVGYDTHGFEQVWVYFPAGAVSGDATGGIYYVQFSSTTVGIVYAGKKGGALGLSAPFNPYAEIPTTLTRVTGSNAAYTQTIGSEIQLSCVKVPGGAMGPNGRLRITQALLMNGSADTRSWRTQFGGNDPGATYRVSVNDNGGNASVISSENQLWVANQGALNKQACSGGFSPGIIINNWGGVYKITVNTAVDQLLYTGVTISGTGTSHFILDNQLVEVIPT